MLLEIRNLSLNKGNACAEKLEKKSEGEEVDKVGCLINFDQFWQSPVSCFGTVSETFLKRPPCR